MKVKCVSKIDADKVESDLRYLYFLDEDPPFLKWGRKGKIFEVINDNDGYVKKYLSKEKSRVFY